MTATLTDGTTVRTAYLLGADGGHSTVRRELGLKFEGGAFPEQHMRGETGRSLAAMSCTHTPDRRRD